MLAAAALNKNMSLLSCRIKSVEKEDLQMLWSEQTATTERYNTKEKSQISPNTVDQIYVKILKSATKSRDFSLNSKLNMTINYS